MNWINVDDKMPNDYKYVLVYAIDGRINVAYHSSCRDGWENDELRDDFGVYWHEGDITHWLPLPEPPKE